MDRYLADLIIEHGAALLPYLKIRAYYCKLGNGDTVTLPIDADINSFELKAMKITGLIDYEVGDRIVVKLKDQDNFLGYPEDMIASIKLDRETFVPVELRNLAETLGYPGDWEKSIPKYRKLYVALTDRVPSPIIQSVAIWTAREYPDYGLNTFLATQCFDSLRSKMERPKDTKTMSRVESSGYDTEDSFEEFDRKLMGNGNRTI